MPGTQAPPSQSACADPANLQSAKRQPKLSVVLKAHSLSPSQRWSSINDIFNYYTTGASLRWIRESFLPTSYLVISVKMSAAGRFIAILCLRLFTSRTTRSLYAANYGGTVSHLSLEQTAGAYSVTLLSESFGCGYNPAWMELDKSKNILMCLNEAYVSLAFSRKQSRGPSRGTRESCSRDRRYQMLDHSQP